MEQASFYLTVIQNAFSHRKSKSKKIIMLLWYAVLLFTREINFLSGASFDLKLLINLL
jgi:hypothetical protein